MYATGVPGAQAEFTAYRLLYCLYRSLDAALSRPMLQLSEAQRREPAVAHALRVCTAVSQRNYVKFFALHRAAPNMSAFLMDYMVPAQRSLALRTICVAFRPSMPLDVLERTLGFAHYDNAAAALKKYLLDKGCALDTKKHALLTKESLATLK